MASNSSLDITVILSTFNRCERLAQALSSLAGQVLPEDLTWEVLVVDNNSTDATRRVVDEFSQRFGPRFHYLFEAQQGKSKALNAGVSAARGTVLAFTDDDVVAEPNWLNSLTKPLRSGVAAGASGRTYPDKDFSPPAWLSLDDRYALAPLALFDLGNEETELLEAPFGNNMAFRAELFAKYGGFRTDLGPQAGAGSSRKTGEDTELSQRFMTGGEQFRYIPAAVIYHDVPPGRVNPKYFLAWWYDKARSDLRVYGIPDGVRWAVAGVPLYLLRRMLRWAMQWMVSLSPSRRFTCKIQLWSLAGTIRECHNQSVK